MTETTTKEQMMEALRELKQCAAGSYVQNGKVSTALIRAIELAHRLPTTCREAHEPTEAVVDAGGEVLCGHDLNNVYTMPSRSTVAERVYRAMERARVGEVKP